MATSEAQRMMAYDAQKKSVLVAYLLWWFLGSLGAHRFYLGRTGSAVAMLVITLVSIPLMLILIGFVGIAVISVWWIVDAFLIPGIAKIHNMKLATHLG